MTKRSADRTINVLTCALVTSFYIYNLDTRGSLIMLGITVLIFLISGFSTHMKYQVHIDKFHLRILAFAAYCAISALWSRSSNLAIEKAITIIEILICMSIIMLHYKKHDTVGSLLQIVRWASYIVGVYTLSSFSFSQIMSNMVGATRLGTTYTNINSVGMLAAYGVIIGVYDLLDRKSVLTILLSLFDIIIIAFSGSRKAIIVMVIGVTFLFLYRTRSRNLGKRILSIILVLGGVYFVVSLMSSMSLFSGVSYRIQRMLYLITGEGRVDSSTLTRQRLISAGWRQFLQTPILGMGIGNPRFLSIAEIGKDVYLHNNYVELLAGGGIIGFALYYFNHFDIIRNIYTNRYEGNKENSVIIGLLFGMLVADYGAVSYYSKYTFFFMMIFYLHLNRLNEEKKETRFIGDSSNNDQFNK